MKSTTAYRVLFFGELDSSAGYAPEQVQLRFGQEFGVSAALLKQVFSGRKVAIRTGLTEKEAFSLQGELLALGMRTRIEASGELPGDKQPQTDAGQPGGDQPPQTAGEKQKLADMDRYIDEQLDQKPSTTELPEFPGDSPFVSEGQMQGKDLDAPEQDWVLDFADDADASSAASPSAGSMSASIGPAATDSNGLAPVHSSSSLPIPDNAICCRQCNQMIAPAALHCRYCGARQRNSRSRGLALAMILSILLLVLLGWLGVKVGVPALEQARTAEQVMQGADQGRQVADHVEEFYLRTGFIPSANLDAGLPEPETWQSEILEKISVSSGGIVTVMWNSQLPEIGGKTLVFAPHNEEQGMTWQCAAGTLEKVYWPRWCRGQVGLQSDGAQPLAESVVSSESGSGGERDNFIIRVVEEEVLQSAPLRQAAAEYFSSRNKWPVANWEMDMPPAQQWGSHASRSIGVLPNGNVLVRFSNAVPELGGLELQLVPLVRNGSVSWSCEGSLPQKWRPATCGGFR